jgi:hypothetical protein
LGELYALAQDSCIETVYILGDLNAHPQARFGEELINFCSENEWVCADIVKLGISSETYTYVSEAHGCQRWLDHCIVSKSAWQTIQNIKVLYDIYWSDHFPVQMECDLGLIHCKVQVSTASCNNSIVWGVRSAEEIENYASTCNNKLKLIDFPSEFQLCADKLCCDINHRIIIDRYYKAIIEALSGSAVDSCTNRLPQNIKRNRCLRGWNRHVAEAHKQARIDFSTYVWYGRPQCGPIYEAMYHSRKIFKSRLRFCQVNQEQISMDVLSSQHKSKQFSKFWKSTKKLNGKVSMPASVDGISDPVSIANMFGQCFKVDSTLQAQAGSDILSSTASPTFVITGAVQDD